MFLGAILPALLLGQTVPRSVSVTGAVVNPKVLPYEGNFPSRFEVPAGYGVLTATTRIPNPRVVLPLPDGRALISSNSTGRIYLLEVGKEATIAATGYAGVHGLAEKDGAIFWATVTELWRGRLDENGRIVEARRITDKLPQGGQHARRNLLFDREGKLLVGIGSRTNDFPAPQPEDACILRMNPDGTGMTVWAKGLRNTMAFAFHPATDALWGWDHGSDYRGDDLNPEELNRIEEGKDYGWPYVSGNRQPDRQIVRLPKGYSSLEEYARTTEPAVLDYQAHSAPIATAFSADGRDMFVTMRGSWNRSRPTGYEVVRVPFGPDGRPGRPVAFMTGWLGKDGKTCLGRPAGFAILKDGQMLVTDDTNGVVYVIRRR